MKNKLAIGLGLALGLTSGLCSADTIPLNVSAVEISPTNPGSIDTSSLAPNTLYDITCDAYNIHNQGHSQIRVSVDFPSVNMGPVLLHNLQMHRTDKQFFGKLQKDKTLIVDPTDEADDFGSSHNKIEFQRFIVNGSSTANTKINVEEINMGYKEVLYGFVMKDCVAKTIDSPVNKGEPRKSKKVENSNELSFSDNDNTNVAN